MDDSNDIPLLGQDELVARIESLDPARRHIVAVAGAPGSGKSTFAEWLAGELEKSRPGEIAVLPMDGFHFDDIVLNARGHRPRKGAPHTFDTGGLAAMLARLAADDGSEIAVPVFDRAIEIARAGARIIGPEARLIIAEGNYLLLDDPSWAPVRRFFDLTVMLDVPEEELHRRLTARWTGFKLDSAEIERKVEGNDMPNARLVIAKSVPADMTVRFASLPKA
ncbi:nucleoside/nucleotide kinase family protein [Consotaella salsifontis]|uniref:Panthothenate kinase n=1 Tax=Consotaella salsifontis TaxID=1365950 RepID=A0A1T4N3J1_9HYPH|nr:nucleoside/nucleotide kinase family protein [Consotaella salsifontis]SJZ73940.1 Panthothenate kinase [Consotaella salsifontis]